MTPAQYGFPRSRRLTTAGSFKRVFAKALKSSDNYLTVLARDNGSGLPRLGLAIAKRNVKLAKDRNRIKRLARESFRLHQQSLPGLDLVVMARTTATQADHETISRSLHQHWANLVKQCKPSWSPSSSSTAT